MTDPAPRPRPLTTPKPDQVRIVANAIVTLVGMVAEDYELRYPDAWRAPRYSEGQGRGSGISDPTASAHGASQSVRMQLAQCAEEVARAEKILQGAMGHLNKAREVLESRHPQGVSPADERHLPRTSTKGEIAQAARAQQRRLGRLQSGQWGAGGEWDGR